MQHTRNTQERGAPTKSKERDLPASFEELVTLSRAYEKEDAENAASEAEVYRQLSELHNALVQIRSTFLILNIEMSIPYL